MTGRERPEENGAIGDMLQFLSSHAPHGAGGGEEGVLWSPPADVYEGEGRLHVVLEIAGMRSKDFRIRVEKDSLIIRGERRPPRGDGERRYLSLERPAGPFEKRVPLPDGYDRTRPKSRYLDGVLEISFPAAVRSAKP